MLSPAFDVDRKMLNLGLSIDDNVLPIAGAGACVNR